MLLRNPRRAAVEVFAFIEGASLRLPVDFSFDRPAPNGVRSSADARSRFEDLAVVADSLKLIRRAKPGHARAEDQHTPAISIAEKLEAITTPRRSRSRGHQ